ncbi:MAG: hypothetical protein EBS59_08250 [Verrucomicrobia bacterium]|nr:hypothetical protein [Verrucomicrobiota bacterium]
MQLLSDHFLDEFLKHHKRLQSVLLQDKQIKGLKQSLLDIYVVQQVKHLTVLLSEIIFTPQHKTLLVLETER